MSESKCIGSRVIEVIEIIVCEGEGTKEDVCRLVTYYYSKQGVLLAIGDPKGLITNGKKLIAELEQEG